MSARQGRSALGCLFTLLLLTAVAYFGVNVTEVYLRYYRFRDAMQQQVHFARMRTDDDIKRQLATFADSLGLPPEAAAGLQVRRGERSITVWSEYSERVELPLVAREIEFAPLVEGPL